MKQKWIPQVGENFYIAECMDMKFIPMMFVAHGKEHEFTKTWFFRTKRNFIGFELQKEYFDISNERINNERLQLKLF